MPRNETGRLSGIASTVHRKYLAPGGTIFSSPVIKATCPLGLMRAARS